MINDVIFYEVNVWISTTNELQILNELKRRIVNGT